LNGLIINENYHDEIFVITNVLFKHSQCVTIFSYTCLYVC